MKGSSLGIREVFALKRIGCLPDCSFPFLLFCRLIFLFFYPVTNFLLQLFFFFFSLACSGSSRALGITLPRNTLFFREPLRKQAQEVPLGGYLLNERWIFCGCRPFGHDATSRTPGGCSCSLLFSAKLRAQDLQVTAPPHMLVYSLTDQQHQIEYTFA